MRCSAYSTAACAGRRSPRRAPSSTRPRRITAAPSLARFSRSKTASPTLNHYHDAAWKRRRRVDAAQRTLNFPWRSMSGCDRLSTVVTSQTAALQTQLEALNLETLQLRASVDLIRALGGGWEDSANGLIGGEPRG